MNGMFGGFQVPQTSLPQLSVPEPKPAPKGGMFGGKPDWASAIQAVIGGYLSGMGAPGGRELLGQVHQRQMMAQQQAMMQQQRQADMEDFEKKQQIELRYRPPAQPTEYERLLQARGIVPGSDDYNKHLDSYLNMRENPPQYRIDPTTGAVIMLQSNPGLGAPAPAGVTFTPIDDGGPSPQGSGGFPY